MEFTLVPPAPSISRPVVVTFDSDIYVFDPQTTTFFTPSFDRWTSSDAPPYPLSVTSTSIASSNSDSIFLFQAQERFLITMIYKLSLGRWRYGAPLKSSATLVTNVINIDAMIYLLLGNETSLFVACYNPQVDGWSMITWGAIPYDNIPNFYPTNVYFSGSIFFFGGQHRSPSVVTNEDYRFDNATGVVSQISHMSVSRMHSTAVVVDDRIMSSVVRLQIKIFLML